MSAKSRRVMALPRRLPFITSKASLSPLPSPGWPLWRFSSLNSTQTAAEFLASIILNYRIMCKNIFVTHIMLYDYCNIWWAGMLWIVPLIFSIIASRWLSTVNDRLSSSFSARLCCCKMEGQVLCRYNISFQFAALVSHFRSVTSHLMFVLLTVIHSLW